MFEVLLLSNNYLFKLRENFRETQQTYQIPFLLINMYIKKHIGAKFTVYKFDETFETSVLFEKKNGELVMFPGLL